MGFVRLIALVVLWKGLICSSALYELFMPMNNVSAQLGLCVAIPCQFTFQETTEPALSPRGFWFRKSDKAGAFNDRNVQIYEETRGRFQLVGDPRKKDCTLSINDVKRTDTGSYYFRYEHALNTTVKFSYLATPLRVKAVELTDKPEIVLPEVLAEGTMVRITCTAPGRCSGTLPQISWKGVLDTEHLQVNSSIKNANGTETHTSTMTFLASRRQHNTSLICEVFFPSASVSAQEAVLLNIQDSLSKDNITLFQGRYCMGSGIFIGIIIGNLVVLALIGIAAFCVVNKFRKKYRNAEVNKKSTVADSPYEDLRHTAQDIYINLEKTGE